MNYTKKNQLWIFFSCWVIALVISWPFECFAQTEILKVRSWAAPDHTRVVFDLADEPNYQFQIKDNLLVLEFTEATLHPSLPYEKKVGKPGIDKITFTAIGGDQCRIEIVLDHYLKADVFKLKKFMDKPDRVVVDVFIAQAGKEEAMPEPVTPSPFRKRVIIIDPGHGGDDPGAIGKKGTYEKDVVLAISRQIKKTIDKMPGYRAILTRKGDYYVSFNKRLQTAKDANASLFISIHADAARNRQARGGSVYCLSMRGASNEAAKLLANNENLSDIIGGVQNGDGNNQSDEIILNMFQTNTINLSKTYATGLLRQLGLVHSLKYPVFHEAPFRVLKLPDTPAVLIETAFLSNGEEEKKLKKNSFHKTVAQAVALSIEDYFSSSTAIAASSDKGKGSERLLSEDPSSRPVKTNVYRVKRGESLASIAQKHETTLSILLKLNAMKLNDPLHAGRKILVPASDVKPGDAKPLKTYVVKKGDTLFSVARNNAVTVDEIRRVNKMNGSDSLLLGQKIKIPASE